MPTQTIGSEGPSPFIYINGLVSVTATETETETALSVQLDDAANSTFQFTELPGTDNPLLTLQSLSSGSVFRLSLNNRAFLNPGDLGIAPYATGDAFALGVAAPVPAPAALPLPLLLGGLGALGLAARRRG